MWRLDETLCKHYIETTNYRQFHFRKRQKVPDTHEAYANHMYEMDRSHGSSGDYAEVGMDGGILSQASNTPGVSPGGAARAPALPSLETLPRNGVPVNPSAVYSMPSKKKKHTGSDAPENASHPPPKLSSDNGATSDEHPDHGDMNKTPELPRKSFNSKEQDEDDFDMTIVDNDLYGT